MERFTTSGLNRLGERLAGDPTESDKLAYLEYRAEHEGALLEVKEWLIGRFSLGIVGSRLKTLDSVVGKVRRSRTRLATMQDIAGCRLIVQDIRAQDEAVSVVRAEFPGAPVWDRREDTSAGYRAVHVVVERQSRRVEVQIRTERFRSCGRRCRKSSRMFTESMSSTGRARLR